MSENYHGTDCISNRRGEVFFLTPDTDADGACSNAKLCAVLEKSGAYPFTFEKGAIGRIQIFEVYKRTAHFEQTMVPGNFGIVQAEISSFATNDGPPGLYPEFQALIGAGSDQKGNVHANRKAFVLRFVVYFCGPICGIGLAKRRQGRDHHGFINTALDLDDRGVTAAGTAKLNLGVLGNQVVFQQMLLPAMCAASLHGSNLTCLGTSILAL